MACMSKGASGFIMAGALGAAAQAKLRGMVGTSPLPRAEIDASPMAILRGRLGTSASAMGTSPTLSTAAPTLGRCVYAVLENEALIGHATKSKLNFRTLPFRGGVDVRAMSIAAFTLGIIPFDS